MVRKHSPFDIVVHNCIVKTVSTTLHWGLWHSTLLCPIPFHMRWNKICLNQSPLHDCDEYDVLEKSPQSMTTLSLAFDGKLMNWSFFGVRSSYNSLVTVHHITEATCVHSNRNFTLSELAFNCTWNETHFSGFQTDAKALNATFLFPFITL